MIGKDRAAWLQGLNVMIPVVAVVLALLTVAIILRSSGISPGTAFSRMIDASVSSPFAISATIAKTLPRLIPALGIALAIRAGLWNIGAEGQIYVGAIAATAVVLHFPELPFPLVTILALAAGSLGGALWGAIPGALRAFRGTNEVITTLMLVYVGIQLSRYFVEEVWSVPMATFPATEPFPDYAKLPVIVPNTLLNAGVFVALVAVLVAWFVVSRTTFGVYLRSIGGNERAAQAVGIPVKRMLFSALAISGAFAGLAGTVEVLGVRGRLIEGFSAGYGFEAIAVALLGRLNPGGIVAGALLFGALDVGGAGLQASGQDIPAAVVRITAALAVLYLLVGMGVRRWFELRRERRAAIDDDQPKGEEAIRTVESEHG